MAHTRTSAKYRESVFITGVPGAGLQTLSGMFKGFYTDNIGYRGNPWTPEAWLIDLNRLHYLCMEGNPKLIVGFGQNYIPAMALPWRKVGMLVIGSKDLLRNVAAYRSEQRIDDGKTAEEVTNGLLRLQKEMLEDIASAKLPVTILQLHYDGLGWTNQMVANLRTFIRK